MENPEIEETTKQQKYIYMALWDEKRYLAIEASAYSDF